MIKPASFRAALVAAIPSLAREPDKLAVFVDQGAIVATGTRSLSFEYRYTLNAIIEDYAGSADTVFVAVVEWVRTYQPDLVTNPDERERGITFEVDILNNETSDLSIKLRLTESVVVTTGDDGQRIIKHVDDSKVDENHTFTWVAEPVKNGR